VFSTYFAKIYDNTLLRKSSIQLWLLTGWPLCFVSNAWDCFIWH